MSKVREILAALYDAVEGITPTSAPSDPFVRWARERPLSDAKPVTGFRAFRWDVESWGRGSVLSTSTTISRRAVLALRVAYPVFLSDPDDVAVLGVEAAAADDEAAIVAALTRKRPLPSQSVSGVGPLIAIGSGKEGNARVHRFTVDYSEVLS